MKNSFTLKFPELIRRAAAFLLLKDSIASFTIEGEFPPNMRARNWGKAIVEETINRIKEQGTVFMYSKSRAIKIRL